MRAVELSKPASGEINLDRGMSLTINETLKTYLLFIWNTISMATSKMRGRRKMGRVTRRCQEQKSLSHVAVIQFLPRNGESVDAKSVRREGGEGRRRREREEREGGGEREGGEERRRGEREGKS